MSHPHKCPICEGRGFVPDSFYDTNPYVNGTGTIAGSSTSCRACNGAGILWAPLTTAPPMLTATNDIDISDGFQQLSDFTEMLGALADNGTISNVAYNSILDTADSRGIELYSSAAPPGAFYGAGAVGACVASEDVPGMVEFDQDDEEEEEIFMHQFRRGGHYADNDQPVFTKGLSHMNAAVDGSQMVGSYLNSLGTKSYASTSLRKSLVSNARTMGRSK